MAKHYNYFRDYDPAIGRYLEGDPIGAVFGGSAPPKGGRLNHLYAYVDSNPVDYFDIEGLEPWNLDGRGDTKVCAYYDNLASQNKRCQYFKEAAEICRGNNRLVNFVTDLGIRNAWSAKRASGSQSEIYNGVRSKLIFYDRQARQMGRIDASGCTCGNTVDFYHDTTFEETGLSIYFYGGNYLPQGFWLNPVPHDPRPR